MVEGNLVYFVTKGPTAFVTQQGDVNYVTVAKVSEDGGKTVVEKNIFFDDEDFAIQFKREVNFTMEPIKIGGPEE